MSYNYWTSNTTSTSSTNGWKTWNGWTPAPNQFETQSKSPCGNGTQAFGSPLPSFPDTFQLINGPATSYHGSGSYPGFGFVDTSCQSRSGNGFAIHGSCGLNSNMRAFNVTSYDCSTQGKIKTLICT